MALRNYTNISKEGQLQTAIGTGDTTIVLSGSGLANIPATPFYIRIDADTASEEIVLVGSGSSATTLLNCTRGYDGTSAFSHGAGAKVRHCVAAEFYVKADSHVETSINVHGLSGGSAVAGTTQTQTLTNKTLNSSVIDLAHTTSPAGSQAVKVSANNATSRDGFVWDNTGGSSGRSVVVRSGGVDRFVVSGNGLVTSNSATGTDKALSVQQSATERFFLQNDGHADFGLQSGGATTDRVRIRTQSTQNALAIKDSGGFNIFTIGGSGNVDASGYIATATNLSATGSLTVGTTASVGTNLSVTGTSTLTGDVTLPLPAAGTTPRLNIRGRTSGLLIEGKDQAGTVTYSMGVDGGGVAAGKWYIHDKSSPVVAVVSGTGVVPLPTAPMVVFDSSDFLMKKYNGATWDVIGRWGLDEAVEYTSTSVQSLANITQTKVQFNNAVQTSTAVTAGGTSNDQFTLNRAGIWDITAGIRHAGAAGDNERALSITTTGDTGVATPFAVSSAVQGSTTAPWSTTCNTGPRFFSAGTQISVFTYQSTGGSINTVVTAPAGAVFFRAVWVGPA